ncbi:unnamed protein product [Cylicostephanus goldi]|uniref:Uncharacterized protein n=1 Tax=Cylicostephanus goldi TaxID=71465 RepID=A0A3P6QSM0_CYLGO|nr:unnamed protein product [Cylicostephanus goldi]
MSLFFCEPENASEILGHSIFFPREKDQEKVRSES